jgi:hypothetical protein
MSANLTKSMDRLTDALVEFRKVHSEQKATVSVMHNLMLLKAEAALDLACISTMLARASIEGHINQPLEKMVQRACGLVILMLGGRPPKEEPIGSGQVGVQAKERTKDSDAGSDQDSTALASADARS